MNSISKLIIGLASALVIVGCGSSPTKYSSEPAKKVVTNSSGVIAWNGEDKAAGASWAQANGDSSNTAEVNPQSKESYSSDTALHFKAKGNDWAGFGWNWENWAEGVGLDTSNYQNLTFMLKVVGKKLPHGGAISAALTSGGPGKQGSNFVSLGDFTDESFINGEWHKITIPISVFVENVGDDAPLDPTLVNGFGMGAWTDSFIDVEYFIDDIGFE